MAADQNRNHVAIQIDAMLGRARPIFTTECCIYKVPHDIRTLNPDAYTPKVVSIGPFHYGNPRLRNMERHKQVYCQKFIERAETSMDTLVSCVQKLEPRVRQSYSESINLNVEKLVMVILVDCGFIFELFMRLVFPKYWTNDDAIISKPWLTTNAGYDLLLLENQLPFFVLDELYSLAYSSRIKNGNLPTFLDLTFRVFDDYNKQELAPTTVKKIEHFADLVRTFQLQPSDRRSARNGNTVEHLGSVTELKEAGVKFMVNKTGQCLLDLQISGHCLEIPKLTVDDFTETLFRNMVALEQCHYPNKSYIIDYVEFLNYLINTAKDVDVLVKYGIISHSLGDSKAVARLFNGLLRNTSLTKNVRFNAGYSRICEELNNYRGHRWHHAKATLRRDYCKTRWQGVASVAAIVLLILTVIQTVCSILQVVP